jgi:hypothetical protein
MSFNIVTMLIDRDYARIFLLCNATALISVRRWDKRTALERATTERGRPKGFCFFLLSVRIAPDDILDYFYENIYIVDSVQFLIINLWLNVSCKSFPDGFTFL